MIQKVASRSCVRGWVSPFNDLKTLSLSTGGKWIHIFESGKAKAARDGLRFSSAVRKIQWDSNPQIPTVPTAPRLWKTFTLTDHVKYL